MERARTFESETNTVLNKTYVPTEFSETTEAEAARRAELDAFLDDDKNWLEDEQGEMNLQLAKEFGLRLEKLTHQQQLQHYPRLGKEEGTEEGKGTSSATGLSATTTDQQQELVNVPPTATKPAEGTTAENNGDDHHHQKTDLFLEYLDTMKEMMDQMEEFSTTTTSTTGGGGIEGAHKTTKQGDEGEEEEEEDGMEREPSAFDTIVMERYDSRREDGEEDVGMVVARSKEYALWSAKQGEKEEGLNKEEVSYDEEEDEEECLLGGDDDEWIPEKIVGRKYLKEEVDDPGLRYDEADWAIDDEYEVPVKTRTGGAFSYRRDKRVGKGGVTGRMKLPQIGSVPKKVENWEILYLVQWKGYPAEEDCTWERGEWLEDEGYEYLILEFNGIDRSRPQLTPAPVPNSKKTRTTKSKWGGVCWHRNWARGSRSYGQDPGTEEEQLQELRTYTNKVERLKRFLSESSVRRGIAKKLETKEAPGWLKFRRDYDTTIRSITNVATLLHSIRLPGLGEWGNRGYNTKLANFINEQNDDPIFKILAWVKGCRHLVTHMAPASKPETLRAFFEAYSENGGDTPVVALCHGTRRSTNAEKIAEGGLRVPGERGVTVLNGSAYGVGIYSTNNPSMAAGYASGDDGVLFICAGMCMDIPEILQSSGVFVYFRSHFIVPILALKIKSISYTAMYQCENEAEPAHKTLLEKYFSNPAPKICSSVEEMIKVHKIDSEKEKKNEKKKK